MNKVLVHEIIKCSEHTPSLLVSMRAERELMNKVLVHEIIKCSENSVRKALTRQACL